MFEIEKILRNSGMTLEKVLSAKEDHAVLQVQRADTGSFVLRLYAKEIPAYKMLARQEIEGVPVVYRTYEEDGCFVVEEERVEGMSLQAYLAEQGTLDETQAVKLIRQICTALKSLHSAGYLHRDVKPEHILLTAEENAVLIDMDAAMQIQPEKSNDTQLMGTVVYAAPEQFGLTRSDQRADIYALGILLNEMLTGEHPTVKRYRNGQLGDIIERCIRMNLEERYQSVEELEAALDSMGSAPPQTDEKRTKKKFPLGIIAAVLAMLVIAGALLWGQTSNPAEGQPETPYNGQTLEINGEEYMQLYKGEGRHTTYSNFRLGYQFDRLYTADGTQVDESWYVYADRQVGFINGWEESFGGWRLQSEGCDINSRGYLYAEKDGKCYAIEVIVTGEPMSAYASIPVQGDITAGYLQPQHNPAIHEREAIKLTYRKGEPLTLYLAGVSSYLEMPACSSEKVSIQPFNGAEAWQNPVFTMTYDNPDGGDSLVEVTSNVGHLNFYFEEE